MTIRMLVPVSLIMLCSCVEEPTAKQAEEAVATIGEDEVEATQMSIEEAAEKATKLIEADAQAEIEEQAAKDSDSN